MRFVWRRGGERRVRKKSRDDSWAEYLHSYIYWIKQPKFVTQIHKQKLNRLNFLEQQWYFLYAATVCLADLVKRRPFCVCMCIHTHTHIVYICSSRLSLCRSVYIYIYIYIYRERERERERAIKHKVLRLPKPWKGICKIISMSGYIAHCSNVDELIGILGYEHKSEDWQLFIDSSKCEGCSFSQWKRCSINPFCPCCAHERYVKIRNFCPVTCNTINVVGISLEIWKL
jgi:hypothetical protein